MLQSLADGDSEGTSSQVESLELYLPVGKTYNLTVDVGHTFYVGELKTWVHNTGPCDLPEWPVGAKATGTVVDDTIKALPAPRQIDASWSASTYKKGGLMTGIEHVFYRH